MIYSDATKRAFLKLQGVLGIGLSLLSLAVVVGESERRPLHGGVKVAMFALFAAALAAGPIAGVWVHKLNVSIRKDKAASGQRAEK